MLKTLGEAHLLLISSFTQACWSRSVFRLPSPKRIASRAMSSGMAAASTSRLRGGLLGAYGWGLRAWHDAHCQHTVSLTELKAVGCQGSSGMDTCTTVTWQHTAALHFLSK